LNARFLCAPCGYIYIYILRTLTRHRRTSMFFLRLGSSDEMQGSLQFFAFGLLSPIFFGRLCDPGAALGCDQAPKTMDFEHPVVPSWAPWVPFWRSRGAQGHPINALKPTTPFLSILGFILGGSCGPRWDPWCSFGLSGESFCGPGLQKGRLEVSKDDIRPTRK